MNQKFNYTDFDVQTVELKNSNLIEASAGTGKTYSIAILVLRLLLENKLPIQEILMVTFTKAAVAELEERIRLFVREAHRCGNGIEIEDETISGLVNRAIEVSGQEEIQNLMKSAILNLDETAVMTIHGFCQLSLNEFAFETNQDFNAELVSDTSEIINLAVQDFWRKNITGIQTELLANLLEVKLSQENIITILNGHLAGKCFVFFDENENYTLDENLQEEFIHTIQHLENQIQEMEDESIKYIESNFEELIKACEKNVHAKKNFSSFYHLSKQFYSAVKGKLDKQFTTKTLPELAERIEAIELLITEKGNYNNDCLNHLYSFAIQEITKTIEIYKTTQSLLTFDDMIVNMNHALMAKENPILEQKLQNKYKAVFIDEFQDTDKLQYEIFHKAFHGNSILFYIGDPKQSIYAFRKADIGTYFKARNQVDKVYSMNVNFRSTPNLVNALNQFFLPTPDFDTFFFGESTDRIDYHPVETPKNDKKGKLMVNDVEAVAVNVLEFPNNDEIKNQLALQVLDLLTNESHSIFDKNSGMQRPIKPSDIGILVRSKRKGIAIKSELSKYGIPAVTVSDAKILQSKEAKELIYVLDAILHANRSKVNRVMLCTFIPFQMKDLLILDEDKAIQQFKDYLEHWKQFGIYATLMKFISDFQIVDYLIDNHLENGERTLTNLYHLIEVLYKLENQQKLQAIEVLNWLKININKNDNNNDEWEQRIENDEDAVRIVTIHSSKGLQYNIVFAPDLDFKFDEKNKNRNYGFRNEVGEYKSGLLSQLSEQEQTWVKEQEEQENRRLLYVALTRTVYKCFIYRSTFFPNSTIASFLKKLNLNTEFIQKIDDVILDESLGFQTEKSPNQSKLIAENFHLEQNNWTRMSYSKLAAHNEWKLKESFIDSDETYDEFIFKNLKKGAKTGNFLHFIFENLNFNLSDSWYKTIHKAILRFEPNADDDFKNNIYQLIDHVMNTQIVTKIQSFQLSEVPIQKCLHELEFDFPVDEFFPKQLEKWNQNEILISNELQYKIQGMMNGKVDLFFEHQNKFYVLDWKSNYLGPNLSDYSSEKLEEAMTDNNYHLQYLIYSIAVKKYLKLRLGSNFNYEKDFGGVIYLFVRGIRKDSNSGIFYAKPTELELDNFENIFKLN